MIKITSELLDKRGIVAFLVEASTPADLETLDMFNAALAGKYEIETGFTSSNKLVVHVKGMPDEIFNSAGPSILK